jgi:hypothetical protein
MTGLDFVFLSHLVSTYVDLYWNFCASSLSFRASFRLFNTSVLQIFCQRICVADVHVGICGFCTRCIRVADFSATHLCCRFLCNTDASSISSMRTSLVLNYYQLMTQTARRPSVAWHVQGQALGQGKAGITQKNDNPRYSPPPAIIHT